MSERDLLLVQLSEAESEIDRIKAELTYTKEMSNAFMDERNNLRSQLAEARAENEKYKAGIEVEGIVNTSGRFVLDGVVYCPDFLLGQRVRVIVLPTEEG